ncbi:DUF4870 domain-containing protein [Alicyclobacillus cycloheptanicus]|nr:DUF4870 domain-containing protein [Alicyclobacillus cycloheptanicus]
MACHLAAFAGWFIPFGWILGPLIVWLIKRDEFPFVDEQGKEALNFHISLLIYGIFAAILCLILIGFVILMALAVFQVVMVIVAAMKVSSGEPYRYPMTIRFIH